MEIVEDNDQWIVLGWSMTPSGWLYAGLEWFNTHQEALIYLEKNLI